MKTFHAAMVIALPSNTKPYQGTCGDKNKGNESFPVACLPTSPSTTSSPASFITPRHDDLFTSHQPYPTRAPRPSQAGCHRLQGPGVCESVEKGEDERKRGETEG
jgi:hypothetical protein